MKRPFLARMVFQATQEEAAAFIARLQALIEECCQAEAQPAGAEELREYAVTAAVGVVPRGGSAG